MLLLKRAILLCALMLLPQAAPQPAFAADRTVVCHEAPSVAGPAQVSGTEESASSEESDAAGVSAAAPEAVLGGDVGAPLTQHGAQNLMQAGDSTAVGCNWGQKATILFDTGPQWVDFIIRYRDRSGLEWNRQLDAYCRSGDGCTWTGWADPPSDVRVVRMTVRNYVWAYIYWSHCGS